MAEAAELRADDFILADFRGREMNRNRQAWDRILLQAQFAHVKIVDYVLRVQNQFDLPIYRHGESGNYDVVFAGRIVGIEAQRIAGRSADLLGVDAAELSVRSGIAEIESELIGGSFDFDGVGFGWRKAGIAPG